MPKRYDPKLYQDVVQLDDSNDADKNAIPPADDDEGSQETRPVLPTRGCTDDDDRSAATGRPTTAEAMLARKASRAFPLFPIEAKHKYDPVLHSMPAAAAERTLQLQSPPVATPSRSGLPAGLHDGDDAGNGVLPNGMPSKVASMIARDAREAAEAKAEGPTPRPMMTKTLLGRIHERMGEELHDATTTPPDNLWGRLGRDPRQMAKEDTDVADVKTAKKIKSALDNKEPPNYGLDSHWEKLAKDEADAADVKTAKEIKSALDNEQPPIPRAAWITEKLAKDEADAKKKKKDEDNADFFKALHAAGTTKAATLDQELPVATSDKDKGDEDDDDWTSKLFGGQASHPETLAMMEDDSQQAAETQVAFPQDSLPFFEESQTV